jgi:flagellar basal-body rod protein FlgC
MRADCEPIGFVDALYVHQGDQEMDHLSAAGKVSAAGMEVQRRRLEVLTGNLVNSNTTKTAGTEPYRRRDVVLATAFPESENFKTSMDAATNEVQGVKIAEVVQDPREPVKRYEPNHPHADKDGYVLYPDIDPAEEMINILSATRSYQANLEARKSTGEMKKGALDILR